ncbi:MAG: OmpA family protein [Candidatus Latescibacterota bacterium]|nr:MAG: OmpA family protein [Candidatus Latescibacterota bacterium]
MAIETRSVIWLFVLALMCAGLTGCGSGGKKNVETDPAATAAGAETPAEQPPGQPVPEPPPIPVDSASAGVSLEDYMSLQADELAMLEDAKTEWVGEAIRITWDSDVLFGFDSAMLNSDAQPHIERMADIFQRYPDTEIVVAGHTDSQGDEDYNFTLSERRALSVRNYLIDAGVPPSRIETVGFGEFRPTAPNDTEEGRAQNRRVEIEIRPNDTLKARAARADSTR